MSFSVGIVGLPNVGKSTLFKALTKKNVEIAPYPFTTINPNIGKVFVPDERLEEITKVIKPEKITPTTIEFVDIAGLVRGAHKGEGLGNQFLAQIRNCDAIVEVIRVFENEKVEHLEKGVNPKRDLEIVEIELLMKDLETVEKALVKLEKEKNLRDKEKIRKLDLLKEIKENLARGKGISDFPLSETEGLLIKEFQFLSQKPIIYLFNINKPQELEIDEELKSKVDSRYLMLNLKLEEEISELSISETKELNLESSLDQLILACYNILDLITFFTITGRETRAWTIVRGASAPESGGKVHSDFEEKFIRAEVINWQELIKAGSLKRSKELGLVKTVGRDYLVQNGDVIEFKI
ncbi:redox-regulated ATPase YchF [Patescibacteria group bacterium]|nr:redox-regulated ATPase YchF [Patescibacteria group bacterium]